MLAPYLAVCAPFPRARALFGRHLLVGDGASAVLLLALSQCVACLSPAPGFTPHDTTGTFLTALANLALVARRRAPVVVLVVCACATALFHMLGYQNNLNNIAVLFALYSVAAYAPPLALAPGVVLGVAVLVHAAAFTTTMAIWIDTLQAVAFVVAAAVSGYGRRILAERSKMLAAIAAHVDREQEERTHRAVTGERLRIARELHDTIAHHASVISAQAGLAELVLTSDPAAARRALTCVGDTARETLRETARLLEVLRLDGEEPPACGLDQLDRLAKRIIEAGVPVELTINGTVRYVPPEIDLCAYRIVQEALTNVLKHARGARTRVAVEYGRSCLLIRVRNRVPPTPSGVAPTVSEGRGLVGMRERVALLSGHMTAAPCPDDGFVVEAVLPLPPVRDR
ncbi:sensor histidine kinase [Nonomuraea sp. NPDC001831]|uniref:sensor histidine kinase n=1 Tax=Nonomuraea sp. NPDC001831 TaxID=3364340 RepID=UPI0036A82D56